MGTMQEGGGGPTDALASWMREGVATPVPAGTTLVPGPADQLCFVSEGWLLRQRVVPPDRPATLGLHLPGDAALLDTCFGAAPVDTLFALTDVVLLRRPVAEFRAAATTQPALLSAVLTRLAGDAAFLREALMAVANLDARQRLVTFLYQTRQRLVACGRVDPAVRTFDLPMTQLQLANAIGVTSVHVNRVLRVLRTAAMLTIANNQVEIGDWEAFARVGSAVAR